jgi:hypothetical protein
MRPRSEVILLDLLLRDQGSGFGNTVKMLLLLHGTDMGNGRSGIHKRVVVIWTWSLIEIDYIANYIHKNNSKINMLSFFQTIGVSKSNSLLFFSHLHVPSTHTPPRLYLRSHSDTNSRRLSDGLLLRCRYSHSEHLTRCDWRDDQWTFGRT